jgi:ketosteroid isomerase-like protein
VTDDLDVVIEQSHSGWGEFVKGNPGPAKKLFSHQDDVTVANPFGPVVRGWKQVADTMERAASLYRDGEIAGFETVAKHASPDLVCIVEVEPYKAKVGGGQDVVPIALRVTSVLRLENNIWKIVGTPRVSVGSSSRSHRQMPC